MSRRLGFLLLALCLPCAGCSGEAGTPPEQTASGDSTAEETLEEPKAAGDGETRAGWRRELREAQAMRRALRRDEALDAFDSIEARAEAAGEEVIALEAVLGQADVLREGGDTAGAIERLGDALARAESLDGTDRARWVAWVLRQRAQALSRGGDGAAAEIDLARAVELLSELGMEDEVAGVEATRSVLAAQTGRLREAVDFGRRALDRLGDGEPTAETLGALSAVAYGLHQLQHTDEALEAYDELIRKAWQRNDQHLLLFAYCNRAEILRTNGYFSESEADLRAAIERIEADRLHLPTGPDARSEALERQVAAYDRLIRLLVDSYRSDEAFAFTERFRGRAFLDLLAAAEASGHVPPTDSAPPDLEELHALLADDQALVSYWLLDDRLLAWVLVAGRAHFVQVPIAQDTLAATVADYLEELRSPALARTAALARTESEHLATGLDLHRQLVASLPHAAREARQLLVVSDGILHYLPLEALPVACDERPESKAPVDTEAPGQTLFAAYDSCRWLGLEQAVTHLPSAAVLVELRRRRRPAHEDGEALVLAPDASAGRPELAGAEREAHDVASILARSRRLEGPRATEAVLASSGRYRYLHFAAHGRISDDEPLSSGIELAANGDDDGLLQADEVLGLDLSCELVTIAACRSGRGVLRRGEGLVGLTRAFLAAGAQSVVVSLWDVDDQASAWLMTDFYTELAADRPPSEAMRLARRQLARRRDDRPLVFRTRRMSYAHPSYWAPYVVVGTP